MSTQASLMNIYIILSDIFAAIINDIITAYICAYT